MTNYVFFGSPKFAQIILEKLVKNHFLPSVLICNPDKPYGRKKIITPPPTKLFILENKLPVKIIQPQTTGELESICKNDKDIKKALFGIVAAYSMIIPKSVINLFPLGIIGVHPSLLPKYRGPSPIQSALLNGEKETGSTLYLLDEKMDHGPILASESIDISDFLWNYQNLLETLANSSANMLIRTLPLFIERKIIPQIQDESKASYTKKFTTQDGFVDLKNDNPLLVARKIKALNPEPGVYTEINKKRIKLLEVSNKNGDIVITKIQPAGKKPQPAEIKLPLL
jgi:methionyl-tRNA formyltransferase